MIAEHILEAAARAACEVNRAYCIALGDESQPHWEVAPDWQKTSVRKGVEGVLAENGPRESHESWLREKAETGWKHGPVKDPEKKEHPCIVPYEDLPPEQRRKDAIFVSTVSVVLTSFAIGITEVEREEFQSKILGGSS
jgi:hypothetical protein